METTTKEPRRSRHSPRANGLRFEIVDRDIPGIFAPIYEHPLLTRLHFQRFMQTTEDGAKKRLKTLTHGTETGEEDGRRYIRRIGESRKLGKWSLPAIYEATEYTAGLLEKHKLPVSDRKLRHTLDEHTFMVSCVGASLEIGVRENPTLRWESRSSILRKADVDITIPCQIIHNGKYSKAGCEPDDLFAIEYLGEKSYFRTFAVECDRGNEPYERANPDETSLHAKFLRYRQVMDTRAYKTHYQRSNLIVLFVFTTTTKMRGFLERVEQWNGGPCSWLACTVCPEFGADFSIAPVLSDLPYRQWQRAGLPPLDISKPTANPRVQ